MPTLCKHQPISCVWDSNEWGLHITQTHQEADSEFVGETHLEMPDDVYGQSGQNPI